MNPADTRMLALSLVSQVVPIWKGDVDLAFSSAACTQVLEDSAQATASVKCKRDGITANPLELGGVQFPKATLDQLLAALSLSMFPPNGMTIGIVVDSLFNPVINQTVSAVSTQVPPPTVKYISANRATFGGTMTTASGIFVSLDASFGTKFSVPGSTEQVGGQIQGKVTVVIIEK
jgi:hypothetical protein